LISVFSAEGVRSYPVSEIAQRFEGIDPIEHRLIASGI
jgi:hypothetical protein